MRYKIKGDIIRSENAAKPHHQASRVMIEWIASQPQLGRVLDYGCGKLRYAPYLLSKATHLTLVDSEIQLSRVQQIHGERTTIRDYAQSKWAGTKVASAETFVAEATKYDFILCSNVLSAIPCVKTRKLVLASLFSAMKSDGQCLFTTQYRNSCFKQMAAMPSAESHLDGWIVKSKGMTSYYGILPKEKLERILRQNCYKILKSWHSGESAYVLTTK